MRRTRRPEGRAESAGPGAHDGKGLERSLGEGRREGLGTGGALGPTLADHERRDLPDPSADPLRGPPLPQGEEDRSRPSGPGVGYSNRPQAARISARSSARPVPFSEEVTATRGKAAGRLEMAASVWARTVSR